MVRGLLGKLASRSLSVAGKWQQQQLRRLNLHEYQGAELMGKHGINVPKGVTVGSVDEVRKALQEVFPNQSEVVVKSQILAGGRGLGAFKNGLQGGAHIVKTEHAEDIAVMTFDGEGEAPVTECGEHGAEGLWRLPRSTTRKSRLETGPGKLRIEN